MDDGLLLIGQVAIIACLELIINMFLDPEKKTGQTRILNVACYAVSLYLVLQFIFDNVLNEVASVMSFAF